MLVAVKSVEQAEHMIATFQTGWGRKQTSVMELKRAMDEFPAISFSTNDRAVAVTVAAARSSRLVLNAFADVFLNPAQHPIQKQARQHGNTETGRVRRLSIKRLVKDLRATGERVVIEQGKNGTTRVLCGEENNKAPDNYWDEKLK